MYKTTFELITSHFSSDRYLDELKQAREEYFVATGKVFEDEPMFESRIAAFLEWFLLDRPLRDIGLPPVRFYVEVLGDSLSDEQKEQVRAMENSIHSLYRVVRRSNSILRLVNLVNDQTYEVAERRQYPGLDKGDILDARLIELKSGTHLTEAIFVHSREGHRFIVEEINKRKKGAKKELQSLLFNLAYMKLKSERYQHIPASEIYDWQTFERDEVVK